MPIRMFQFLKRLRPRRPRHYVIWGVLLAVFVPYLYSRLTSPLRRIASAELEAVPVGAGDSGLLRVACYNIAHGRGLAASNWAGGSAEQRKERLEQIAAQLRQMNADIVVLNEVDFDASWSGGVNQAEELARMAGYRFRVESANIDLRVLVWNLRFGNAILSRFPLKNVAVVDFPGYAVWETLLAGKKRGVRAEVSRGDHVFQIVGAHLSHRPEMVRVESAQMICELAASARGPVIVAGDLNSTPGGFPGHVSTPDSRNAIEVFDSAGEFQRQPVADPGARDFTFPADAADRIIDWILISDDLRFRQYEVVDSTLSDHKAVVAEIRLPE